jgi:predicted MFS family arabinose efflux permease
VGLLADRHGAERYVAPLLVVCAAGVALCVVAIVGENPWLLLLGALVVGVPYGALQNLTLVIAFARVPAPAIPTASAAWNIGFDAGTATGSVVVGAMATASSFGVAFTVMAVVVLAALLAAPRDSPSRNGPDPGSAPTKT